MMNNLVLVLLILSSAAGAQTSSKMRDLFKGKTRIENPFDLRDPFKPPLQKNVDKESRGTLTRLRDGVYTNVSPAGQIDLQKMQIVGVMIGKERRAMARVAGKGTVIVLREGMRIGKDNAELKAIHPGGIILVEKLVNVYGEEEYLETVIPISK
jgi:Tfp pilus assembly protein PilP